MGRSFNFRWVIRNGAPCDDFTEPRLDLIIDLFRDQFDGRGGGSALVWTFVHCRTDGLVGPVLSTVDSRQGRPPPIGPGYAQTGDHELGRTAASGELAYLGQ